MTQLFEKLLTEASAQTVNYYLSIADDTRTRKIGRQQPIVLGRILSADFMTGTQLFWLRPKHGQFRRQSSWGFL